MKTTYPDWLHQRMQDKKLSASQKAVLAALAHDPTKFILVSIKKFAALAGVSPATITRCARALGFNCYEDFQQELQKHQKETQPITSVFNFLNNQAADYTALGTTICEAEQAALRYCIEHIDMHHLHEAAGIVARAKRVHLIGYGSSVALIRFLQYRFMRIGLEVVDMTPISELNMLAEHCVHLSTRHDVIITTSFRGVYQTIEHLMNFAAEFHIPTLAFTENRDSAISRRSAYCIPIKRAVINEFKSLAAPLSIMNMFVMQVAKYREHGKHTISRRLAWFQRYQQAHGLGQPE